MCLVWQHLEYKSANLAPRVTNLRPDDTQDNPFWYMFKVQCTSCRETHDNYVGVNRFVSAQAHLRLNPDGQVVLISHLGNERDERQPG